MEHKELNLGCKGSSAYGDSDKECCSETPQIGTVRLKPVGQRAGEIRLTGGEYSFPSILCSGNLEGLTEKVGALGLRVTRKNRCGAAKKGARKAKLAVAPTGDSGGGQTRTALSGQPRTPQRSGMSRGQQEGGSTSTGLKSPETKVPSQGPSKRQRSARGTPEGRQAKRPKQAGQLSYARAAREGLRVAVVSENCPESQSRKKILLTSSRRSAGVWMSSLRRGSPPDWLTPTG